MKLKRALAWLLALGALTAALALLLAPWALKRFFPPEKIRALIVSQAQKNLHREVRLGEISLSLMRGLSLQDFAVSETPDFSAGTFAAMKSFNLQVRWPALLRKELIVDSVSADGLVLSLIKDEDGRFNFSDIAGSTAAAGAPAPAAGMALAFNVSRAALSQSRITYKDLSTGDSVELSELSARVAHLRLNGPVEIDLSLKSAGRAAGRSLDGGWPSRASTTSPVATLRSCPRSSAR